MRPKLFFILLICSALAATSYYFIYYKKNEIEVTKPTRGPAVLAVYATGTVEASVMIPVAPRLSARLMKLFVDEGQNVTKGMVMAQLEDEDLKNALSERMTAVELAEKEFDRQQRLSKSGAISKQAYDKAQANLESAKANMAQAEANLNYMKLIAPEDGLIIRRDGEIGELIPANQPVLWMSCCSGLRIASEVDEEDIALVKPGQDVAIRADAFPGEVFQGTVQSITPKGDPVARSYRVRIKLPMDSKLMIGMTAETNIIIHEKENALLVPASSVLNDHVFIAKGRKLQKSAVQVGAQTDNKIEIRSGLSGDEVIANNAQGLEDGQTVHTKPVEK